MFWWQCGSELNIGLENASWVQLTSTTGPVCHYFSAPCVVFHRRGEGYQKSVLFYENVLMWMKSDASLRYALCLVSGCELLAQSLASNVVWRQCIQDEKEWFGISSWIKKNQLPVLCLISFCTLRRRAGAVIPTIRKHLLYENVLTLMRLRLFL